MTEFITTVQLNQINREPYSGAISICNENCIEGVTTSLLYQLASGIPPEYSCEQINSSANTISCPGIDTNTYYDCDNTFDCYKTRLATCKTDICMSLIPSLFMGPAMSNFPMRFHTNSIYGTYINQTEHLIEISLGNLT